MDTPEPSPPPAWMVRLNVAILRLGLGIGSQHLLSVIGPTSGLIRSAPVSIATVDGERYMMAAFAEANWVRNARSAGAGVLSRGRSDEPVILVELPVEEREPILRAFLEQVPGACDSSVTEVPTRSWRQPRGTRSSTSGVSMHDEPAVPATSGVAVTDLGTVDLAGEIEGLAGHQLRMRMVTIEPGGTFGPLHDHRGRPGIAYIRLGTITDHRDGVETDYGPGLGWPEDRHTLHWLENRGTETAVEISVDILKLP